MISSAFSGSKIALFNDTKILIYRRDNKPNIPFPGLWNLPGSGREGAETPEECVCREVLEEFGISIPAHRISWSKSYGGSTPDSLPQFFRGTAYARRCPRDPVRR
ncbi:NUDIX domain-containing protein [Caballeronia mineralivorans]|uniref:NUDIX domain-containing protein n=1 Tax=Caballeronia mineralivorans TaxID=2010198 RepID=UPI0019110A3E